MLVENKPEDLLQDVETGFQFFLDKCIYYFKVRDTNKSLEEEEEQDVVDDSIKEDIDYDKEDDIDYDKEDLEDIEEDEDTNKPQLVNEVFRKSKRYVSSDSLPLDWFQRCKKKIN